jgi:hydrogenase maturation protease
MIDSLRVILKGKVLIVGIGNRFRGDDGAGPFLIDCLRGKVGEILLDVGEEPLNYLGVIESVAPDTVLVFDTAQMGEKPGTIRRVNIEGLSISATVSTHSIPLEQILRLIETRTQSNIVLFGVQPRRLELGNGMSPEVRGAVIRFASQLESILGKK